MLHLLFGLLDFHLFPVMKGFESDFAVLPQDFVKVEALLDYLLERTKHGLLAVSKHQDLSRSLEELDLVSDEDDALGSKSASNRLIEDFFRINWLHLEEEIIEQVNFRVLIQGPRKADPRLHTGGKLHASFPHNCLALIGQLFDFFHELGGYHSLAVSALGKLVTKADVFADGAREDERLLFHKRDLAVDSVRA